MSYSFVRRVAIAAAALPLLLSGCTEDEPDPPVPDPTTSPPTTSEITAAPDPWEEQTEDGAVAFAEHWIDLLNAARLDADFEPLRAASAQSCKTCSSFLDILEQLHAPGALYESEPWQVKQSAVTAGVANSQAKVAVRVRAPSERVKEAGEDEIRRHAATTDTYEATLKWAASGWRMQKLVIVE